MNYGLAVILGFLGVKMVIAEFYKVPVAVSLGVVVVVLVVSGALSLVRSRQSPWKRTEGEECQDGK